MKRCLVILCAVVLVLGGAGTARAISVAGYDFDDNAFADVVLGTSGDPVFQRIIGPTAFDRVGTTAEDALLGSDLASSTIELQSSQSVTVGFTDNAIVNRTGADLVIFETFSSPEGGPIQVELAGSSLMYSAVSLGQFEVLPGVTNYINAILVDLSDFGFALGQTTQYVRAWGTSSEFAAFGALNNAPVPEPGTMLLLGSGLLALLALGRKRFF